MTDDDLGMTGKDVSWEMILDGAPQALSGKITDFSETARFATVTKRPLGTIEVEIDKVPAGWEGEFTYTAKNADLETALDLYRTARGSRVPTTVELTSTKRYRDGTSVTHTYRNVQWEMSTSGRRDEAVEHRITWESGLERITA